MGVQSLQLPPQGSQYSTLLESSACLACLSVCVSLFSCSQIYYLKIKFNKEPPCSHHVPLMPGLASQVRKFGPLMMQQWVPTACGLSISLGKCHCLLCVVLLGCESSDFRPLEVWVHVYTSYWIWYFSQHKAEFLIQVICSVYLLHA